VLAKVTVVKITNENTWVFGNVTAYIGGMRGWLYHSQPSIP